MENRRQDYRHALLPHLRLPVELTCIGEAEPIVGVAVNLSVGGMAVQCEKPPLEFPQQCTASIVLPDGQVRLQIPSVLVHESGGVDGPIYRLRFLPLAEPEENDYRERVLWQFLLQDQRRQRRHALETGRRA